jgi:hypothetical protein
LRTIKGAEEEEGVEEEEEPPRRLARVFPRPVEADESAVIVNSADCWGMKKEEVSVDFDGGGKKGRRRT